MKDEERRGRIALRWFVAITTVLATLGLVFLADLVSRTKGREHDDLFCSILWVVFGLLVVALVGTVAIMINRDRKPRWVLMSAFVWQTLMLAFVMWSLTRFATT